MFEESEYRFTDDVQRLSLDVASGQLLKIVVDFGKGQDVGDRIIWADARLVRSNASSEN